MTVNLPIWTLSLLLNKITVVVCELTINVLNVVVQTRLKNLVKLDSSWKLSICLW